MEKKQFTFDTEFQNKILGAIINSSSFLRRFRQHVKPEHFRSDEQWIIATLAYQFFDDQATAPGSFIQHELDKYTSSHRVADEKAELLKTLLERLTYSPDHVEHIASEVVEFIRHEEIRGVLEDFLPQYETGQYDLTQTITDLNKVMTIDAKLADIGEVYFDNTSQRIQRRFGQSHEYIATLIDPLDEKMLGIRAPQIGTIMAPSGVGKSWMLCHLGKAAMTQGKTVFHYTLEMDVDEVSDRYDQMVIGATTEELTKSATITRLHRSVQRLQAWGGNLILCWLDAGSTVETIREHLRFCADRKIYPDLVMVDYGELLEASKNYRGDEYLRQFDIWRGLKQLNKDWNIPSWIPTQASRGAVGAKVVSEMDTSDSLHKFRVSDLFIGFNRNAYYDHKKKEWIEIDKEWDEHTVRLFMIKHRGRADKYLVKFRTDLARGMFYSKKLTDEMLDEEELDTDQEEEAILGQQPDTNFRRR